MYCFQIVQSNGLARGSPVMDMMHNIDYKQIHLNRAQRDVCIKRGAQS